MNKQQRLYSLILMVFVILIVIFSGPIHVQARDINLSWTQNGTRYSDTFDLTGSAEDRTEFRALFQNDPRASTCISRADYAQELMKQRDAGITEEAHLLMMRENYERTKTEPKGAVAYHVYVDFQRMVRDLHRRDGSGFSWKDAGAFWGREVQWCLF